MPLISALPVVMDKMVLLLEVLLAITMEPAVSVPAFTFNLLVIPLRPGFKKLSDRVIFSELLPLIVTVVLVLPFRIVRARQFAAVLMVQFAPLAISTESETPGMPLFHRPASVQLPVPLKVVVTCAEPTQAKTIKHSDTSKDFINIGNSAIQRYRTKKHKNKINGIIMK